MSAGLQTLDAVNDLGADPNFGESVIDVIEGAYDHDTVIEFPPGVYLVDRPHVAGWANNFTIRGLGSTRRDVQFRPDRTIGQAFLRWEGDGEHHIENVALDQTDDLVRSLGILVRDPGGSSIENVEWLGRTPEEGTEGATDRLGYLLTFDVTDTGGVSNCSDVVIGEDAPAEKPPYPRGRPAIRQGPSHRGEAIFRGLRIIDQGSSAFRSTDNPGVCTVRDCYFKDNANANLRFGAGEHPSKVSTAKNCHILLTTATQKPHGAWEVGDAVRVHGDPGQEGALFEDITVDVQAGADVARGAIAAPDWGDHGWARFTNCIVRNDADTRTVNVEEPAEGSFSDRTFYFEGCDFIGTGGGFRLSRPVQFSNCCLGPGLSDPDVSGLVRNDCRPMPADPLGGGDQKNTLVITGTGVATRYTFTVSGTVEPVSGTIEPHDDIIGDKTVEAWVTEPTHLDEWRFSGQVTDFGYIEGGPAHIVLNGAAVGEEEIIGLPEMDGGGGGGGGDGGRVPGVDVPTTAVAGLALGSAVAYVYSKRGSGR